MEAFSKRIQSVMQHYNLSASRLADKCGVQRSAISHILNGRNRPSVTFLMALSEAYPELNTRWLLHGKGNMVTSVSGKEDGTNEAPVNPQQPQLTMTTDAQFTSLPKGTSEKQVSGEKTSRGVFTGVDTNVNSSSRKQHANRTVVQVILLYEDGSFSAHPPQGYDGSPS